MRVSYGSNVAPIPSRLINEVQSLSRELFGDAYVDRERDWRFKHMPYFTVFQARSGANLVGFKMGYAYTRTHYYSWLGGVDPTYRRNGIARELMNRQHAWLCANGYLTVETGARQSNFAMTQLNLASGFKIAGLRHKTDSMDIIFEKSLT